MNNFETKSTSKTPAASSPIENKSSRLTDLLNRRKALLTFIEAGEGTAADQLILKKLDEEIAGVK